ncbi:UrcA family protein [Polymorphobacter fuscus]|nr:UrcA family protein [Polymorphobacter fuscus]NJC07080.1 UrcA family protein [Polymorphobacter fuscus]
MTNNRRLASCIIAATVLVTSIPVLAGPTDTYESVNVDTRGLDLSSPEGAQQLMRRVDYSINKACGPVEFMSRDLAAPREACRAEARAAVAPQLRRLLARTSPRVATN